MDIFFISYKEKNCEDNWHQVSKLHPDAKRIHGIQGIDIVHNLCDKLSSTDYFWTIDGDNWLVNKLIFEDIIDSDLILFHANDPLYEDKTLLGGVKLWTKNKIINKDMSKGDFCLNATKTKKTNSLSFSITKYNNHPFDCWKTSFRHCVKLQSMFFRNRPNATKIDYYLNRWKNCKNIKTKCNASWAYQGYIDSKNWVKKFDNSDSLHNINDYNYLENFFNNKYGKI